MAKNVKSDKDKPAHGVEAKALQRVVGDINRNKEQASEYAGLAGQSAKQGIEQYGLDRAALAFVTKLSRQEPGKVQATLRGVIDYADKLGFFDQVSLFDDLVPTLKGIIERIEGAAGEKPKGEGADLIGALSSALN